MDSIADRGFRGESDSVRFDSYGIQIRLRLGFDGMPQELNGTRATLEDMERRERRAARSRDKYYSQATTTTATSTTTTTTGAGA